MLKNKTSYALLVIIILAFIGIGALYAVNTPPWQAPDEPAHYNYIAQVASGGCCPIIEPNDWDLAALEDLKGEGFPDDADLSDITYEDWQPPLYYLLATPIFNSTSGSLLAIRILSLIFGTGAVAAVYWVIVRLFPRHQILALAATTFVAFIPQHLAILSSVNNDSLAELELGILLVIAMGYVGNPTWFDYDKKIAPYDESMRPHAAAMGGFLGLIFLTKLTPVFPALLLIILAIAWRWRIEGRSAGWLVEQIGWGIGLGVLIGLPWWLRNLSVYGFPDLLGLSAHNAAVTGQLRASELIREIGQGGYLREYFTTTYHSFFGQFGWMGVPMQPRDYLAIGVFLLWALAGLFLLTTRFQDLWRLCAQQRAGVWILMASLLATFVTFIYYNLTFVQFQGRYLYGMLIPLGLMVAAGGWGWVRLLRSWVKGDFAQRALTWIPLLAVSWMPLLALWALFRYIIPNLD